MRGRVPNIRHWCGSFYICVLLHHWGHDGSITPVIIPLFAELTSIMTDHVSANGAWVINPSSTPQVVHAEMQTLYVSWAISPCRVRRLYDGISNTQSNCTALTGNPAALLVTSCYTPQLQCPNPVKHLGGHTGSVCGLISARTLPQKSHRPGWWEKQSRCASVCANF